ncbi:MAG: multidrug ABC transporter ATP-binding protein [Thiothrix nivea]|nr:MAG: multidrug ABC transporter ATP-binding protein [Thiothrix nivea]
MHNNNLLEARGLSRFFGTQRVVEHIDLQLKQGEVLGLLGPNGAGKSTTLQMLAGSLAPATGEVRINGIDLLDEPLKAKHYLGYLPEQPPVYRDMSVNEYLFYCAHLHGMKRSAAGNAVAQVKQRCALQEVQNRLIGNLSKGFQQRVGIAQAVLHQPPLIILDEPTVGLDPVQIREIRALIRELGEEHGVILSTHILPEVQAVCDRVQILSAGRTVFSGELKAIDSLEKTFFEWIGQDDPALAVTEAAA